jgi:hypothetical protein
MLRRAAAGREESEQWKMFVGRLGFPSDEHSGFSEVMARRVHKHNRVKTARLGLKAAHLKTLFAATVFSASNLGIGPGAEAWEGEWDQIVVSQQTTERVQYFPHSGLAIPNVTRFIYLEDEPVNWETYENLKKKREVPRYMMRPPMGHFDKRNGP